jgi:3-methyladenine DNA glycosylase/8-oxoguanine DNA glycosylase
MSTDAVLSALYQKVGQLDWPSLKKPAYVALIGAILGQKIRYTEAKKLRGHVYLVLGNNFSRLALEAQWPQLTLPPDKAVIIQNVNTFLREKNRTPDFPPGQEWACLQELLTVNGIGPWTLTTTMLVVEPYTDLMPCEDLFLQKRLQKLFALPKKPSAKEVAAMSASWSPYRGMITWYLWRWF